MGLLEEVDALNVRSFSSTARSGAASKAGSRSKAASRGEAASKAANTKATIASSKAKATTSAFPLAETSPSLGKGKARAIVVEDDSSEIEPEAGLASAAAPRSSTPAKRRARDSEDEAPPDYSEWTLEDLQSEARRFGFKSSSSRRTVISQLKAVWEALHPIDRRARLSGSPSPFDEMRAGADPSSTQPSFGVLSSDADFGDLTMQLAREGGSATSGSIGTLSRSSSSSSASEETDDEDLDERADAEADAALEADPDNSVLSVPPALSTQIAQAIREDTQLWHRILLMEPISFDEIASVVRSKGVTGIRNKEILRSWLDRQGVCTYFGELTGSRTRY